MAEPVIVGYQAFTKDKVEEFGAIRGVSPDGKSVTVFIENAGEFELPGTAVVDVGFGKVTFDPARLDATVRDAIAHAHDAEIANDDEIEDAGDE